MPSRLATLTARDQFTAAVVHCLTALRGVMDRTPRAITLVRTHLCEVIVPVFSRLAHRLPTMEGQGAVLAALDGIVSVATLAISGPVEKACANIDCPAKGDAVASICMRCRSSSVCVRSPCVAWLTDRCSRACQVACADSRVSSLADRPGRGLLTAAPATSSPASGLQIWLSALLVRDRA